jgi:hypothetical protein
MTLPRITFGIIVLNGEPFTRYNLRALYPFAHEIIVAEGASPLAAHAATPDGHSLDGTLQILRRFKQEEDPENKITLVTAEDEGHPDGFWPGEKDEQSQAYAARATGDWLWQIDIDEFYQPEDMQAVGDYLQVHPETSCLTFQAYHFWGGFDYLVTGGIYTSVRFQGEPRGAYRRVFQWRPGYRYSTHRPPTVRDGRGQDITRRCLRNVTGAMGIRMYHYSLVFPFQMAFKSAYYEMQGWSFARGMTVRSQELLRRIDTHNGVRISNQFGTFNWLVRFHGSHPPAIATLRHDAQTGGKGLEMRQADDMEALLANPAYVIKTHLLWPIEWVRACWHLLSYLLPTRVRRPAGVLLKHIARPISGAPPSVRHGQERTD